MRGTTAFALFAGLALTAAALAGCGRDNPAEPATYALSGRVQLVGRLTAANGQPAGSRLVDDADGVPVDLLLGNRIVAKTHTVDGVYRFSGVAPGGYYVRANYEGAFGVLSDGLTVASRDVVAAAAIVMNAAGDLYPAPNPVDSTCAITFTSDTARGVDVRVIALDGTVVRHLLVASEESPGLFLTVWDGKDDYGAVPAPGAYWMRYTLGADERAQLLFR